MRTVQKASALFVSAVLLVTLVVLLNEVATLNSDERALTEAYERQMDGILFSVNQHAWDVVDTWIERVDKILAVSTADQMVETRKLPEDAVARLTNFVDPIEELAGVSVVGPDGILETITSIRWDSSAIGVDEVRINGVFPPDADSIRGTEMGRRVRWAGVVAAGSRDLLSVGFLVSNAREGGGVKAALLIDPVRFIEEVVGVRLRSLGTDDIDLQVRESKSGRTVFSAGGGEGNMALSRRLWVLQDYEIGIVMARGSTADIARRRAHKSLALVTLLAVVIAAGTWFVYRAARRESDLARLKSDFVSNVSHELRTPLSVISMYAETLELGRVESDEKRYEYYRIISDESMHLSRLVNNVLNFSRIESGSGTYSMETVDLGDIAGHIEDAFRVPLQRQGFRFGFERAEGMLTMRGDALALEEVVVNLLDNAVKYSNDRKSVTLRVGRAGEDVFLEVEYRGIGIDPVDADRVFEKFYRVETGLVRNTRGTGLGLALVKHVVEAHGGSVVVRSEPGSGSCFRLVFTGVCDVHEQ